MSSFLTDDIIRCYPDYPEYFSNLKKLEKHQGIRGVVLWSKDMKAWALNLIVNPMFSISSYSKSFYRGFVIPGNLGFKKIFKHLCNAIIRNKFSRLRYILSCLNVYQRIPGPLKKLQNFEKLVSQHGIQTKEEYIKVVTIGRKALNIEPCYFPPIEVKSVPTGQTVAILPGKNGEYPDYLRSGRKNFHPDATERIPYFQGNLVLIGDDGGKDRLVLIGHPVCQTILKPLQKVLLDILKEIPTDCTFKQDEGVKKLVELSKDANYVIHSIDLSDCTWNLPYILQEILLLELGVPREYLTLLRLPVYMKNKFINVEKGQAMGLNPSFPLFSLFHNILLTGFCIQEGVKPDCFRILGDDVILWNDNVRQRYLQFLNFFEVPISSKKTFSSKFFGEFAGQIILKGVNITPIKSKDITASKIQLYNTYKTVLGKKLRWLNHCSLSSFLIIGGLPRRYGGLGIGNFDSLKGFDICKLLNPHVVNKGQCARVTVAVLQCRISIMESYKVGFYAPSGSVRKYSIHDEIDVDPFTIQGREVITFPIPFSSYNLPPIFDDYGYIEVPVKTGDPKFLRKMSQYAQATEKKLVSVFNIGSPYQIFKQFGIVIALLPGRSPSTPPHRFEVPVLRMLNRLDPSDKELNYEQSRTKLWELYAQCRTRTENCSSSGTRSTPG